MNDGAAQPVGGRQPAEAHSHSHATGTCSHTDEQYVKTKDGSAHTRTHAESSNTGNKNTQHASAHSHVKF